MNASKFKKIYNISEDISFIDIVEEDNGDFSIDFYNERGLTCGGLEFCKKSEKFIYSMVSKENVVCGYGSCDVNNSKIIKYVLSTLFKLVLEK